jgi:hypothetical protein
MALKSLVPWKRNDRQLASRPEVDFPFCSLTRRGRWSAQVDVDLPVDVENSALQIVPDYRVRSGVSVQF